MYDETVKRLKNCATQAAPCLTCDMADDGSCIETLMKQAADAIEELSKTRWIPVTERLPETYGTRLVTTARGSVMVCCYYPQAKNWNTRATVTHWMPLPEPPKEET